MKSDDVAVGDRVIKYPRTLSSPKFDGAHGTVVTVVKTGQSYLYRTSGGWSSYGHTVNSDRGILVRFPDGHEEMTLATFLKPATEDNLAVIEERKKQQAEAVAARKTRLEQKARVGARLKEMGISSVSLTETVATMSLTMMERMLDVLSTTGIDWTQAAYHADGGEQEDAG